MERVQRERDKAILDRDQVALERDQAKLDREQATLERDEAILDRDLLMAERVQDQRLQESIANCDQIKSELERLQRSPFHTAQDSRGCSPLDHRGQLDTSVVANPGVLEGGGLEFFWCSNTPDSQEPRHWKLQI